MQSLMTMFDEKLCVKQVISPVKSVVSGAKWENSFEVLTLDNMGDHQRRTGVITSQTSGGNVLFDLESKQVPAHKHKPFSLIQQGRFTLRWHKRRVLHFTQDNRKVSLSVTSSQSGNDKLRKPLYWGKSWGKSCCDQLRVVQQPVSADQCSHAPKKIAFLCFSPNLSEQSLTHQVDKACKLHVKYANHGPKISIYDNACPLCLGYFTVAMIEINNYTVVYQSS